MYLGDLKRLAIFASVSKLGSFTRAAEELNMSRSGVSEQVGLLEQSLGVRLLHRTTRQVTLTTDGEAIYQQASKLPDLVEAVRDVSERDLDTGRIRITATIDVAQKWLISQLANFQQSNPGIDFDLIISDETLDLVSESIDLAVRVGPLKDANLIARPLRLMQPKIIASTALLEKYPDIEHPNDLVDLPWVLLEPINVGGNVVIHSAENKLVLAPKRYSLSDSPMATNHMIQQGMGVGFQIPEMVEQEIREGKLKMLFPEWGGITMHCQLIYSSRRHLAGRVRRLIDYLLAE